MLHDVIESLWPLLLLIATALARAMVARLRLPSPKQRYTVQLTLDSHARMAFGIDVTGSMSTRDCPDKLTRLEYACRCVQYMVDTAPPELRRVDIIAFGTTVRFWGEIGRDEVGPLLARLTASESQTYTGAAVRKASRMLVSGRSGVLVLFTDGEPQDPVDLTMALSDRPTLKACALSVGRVRLDCVVARAEETLFAWQPRHEPPRPTAPPPPPAPEDVTPTTPRIGPPLKRRLKYTPKPK